MSDYIKYKQEELDKFKDFVISTLQSNRLWFHENHDENGNLRLSLMVEFAGGSEIVDSTDFKWDHIFEIAKHQNFEH